MDAETQGTDADVITSDWLTVAEAAALLGKTERTVRRYASGEIRTPPGLDIDTKDGRVRVRRTDVEGRVRPAVPPLKGSLLAKLEASRELLREKEILIAGLEAELRGKEELLEDKEARIEDLRTARDKDARSIEHLEILLSQAQAALPAPRGRRPVPMNSEQDTTTIEASPGAAGVRLWIRVAVGLALLALLAYTVWYVFFSRPADPGSQGSFGTPSRELVSPGVEVLPFRTL